jgi:hypothetical protein
MKLLETLQKQFLLKSSITLSKLFSSTNFADVSVRESPFLIFVVEEEVIFTNGPKKE